MHSGFDAGFGGGSVRGRPRTSGGLAPHHRRQCARPGLPGARKGLVARDCTCGGGFARLGVPVLRHDGDSTRFGDGVVALPGVTGPVGSDAGDLLIRRGPAGQSGQHGCITLRRCR